MRVNLIDDHGRHLVWWTAQSNEFDLTASIGDQVTIKATIKEHTAFKGIPQVMVSRVKIVDEIKQRVIF